MGLGARSAGSRTIEAVNPHPAGLRVSLATLPATPRPTALSLRERGSGGVVSLCNKVRSPSPPRTASNPPLAGGLKGETVGRGLRRGARPCPSPIVAAHHARRPTLPLREGRKRAALSGRGRENTGGWGWLEAAERPALTLAACARHRDPSPKTLRVFGPPSRGGLRGESVGAGEAKAGPARPYTMPSACL